VLAAADRHQGRDEQSFSLLLAVLTRAHACTRTTPRRPAVRAIDGGSGSREGLPRVGVALRRVTEARRGLRLTVDQRARGSGRWRLDVTARFHIDRSVAAPTPCCRNPRSVHSLAFRVAPSSSVIMAWACFAASPVAVASWTRRADSSLAARSPCAKSCAYSAARFALARTALRASVVAVARELGSMPTPS
jgi:hypothetical protein